MKETTSDIKNKNCHLHVCICRIMQGKMNEKALRRHWETFNCSSVCFLGILFGVHIMIFVVRFWWSVLTSKSPTPPFVCNECVLLSPTLYGSHQRCEPKVECTAWRKKWESWFCFLLSKSTQIYRCLDLSILNHLWSSLCWLRWSVLPRIWIPISCE